MILESIVTTLNDDGTPNISPMGPTVPEDSFGTNEFKSFTLRPFHSSRTFANLKRHGSGVLHVTDDVEIFAKAAIGRLEPVPELTPATSVEGFAIVDACRWYEFEVEFIDETGPRMHLNCRVVKAQRNRDFWGFNRAKHAVIEAAILATRVDFLPAEEISQQFLHLQSAIEKTSGPRELAAFQLLCDFVGHPLGAPKNA
ncbi:MAG: hypothetical protein ACI87E_000323 [Mariniblastus sp.]|jgi:hypothetical protein